MSTDEFYTLELPPFSGHRLRLTTCAVEIPQAEISQGGMTPPPIRESFYRGNNGRLCLLPLLKRSTINPFGFQARKEALPDGSVPTMPRSAHGTRQAVPCASLVVLSRRILAAAIRVMEQRPHDLPLGHRQRECRACVTAVGMRASSAQPTTR
jgi:hypothetical protein